MPLKNVCWLCTSEVYRTTIYTISYYLTKRKDKDENSTNDSTDATEIVSIANRFKNCDIDAQFGRYVIDLKSILGVLSFGLPKDIDINIMGPEIDIEIFNKAIKKWRV